MRRGVLAGAALGALAINGVLLSLAAQLVRDRPVVQDITEPVPVTLVPLPREEALPEREVGEPAPPRPAPSLDFAPELPLPSLTAPRLAGPAVQLDPGLFGPPAPVRDLVFEATDLDQLPRALIRNEPIYPYKARQRRLEGRVRVRFLVGRDGTVGQIVIEEADPPGVFEDAVRDAVARWRYEPGRIAGEPVATWVVLPVSFDLETGRP